MSNIAPPLHSQGLPRGENGPFVIYFHLISFSELRILSTSFVLIRAQILSIPSSDWLKLTELILIVQLIQSWNGTFSKGVAMPKFYKNNLKPKSVAIDKFGKIGLSVFVYQYSSGYTKQTSKLYFSATVRLNECWCVFFFWDSNSIFLLDLLFVVPPPRPLRKLYWIFLSFLRRSNWISGLFTDGPVVVSAVTNFVFFSGFILDGTVLCCY